MVKHLLDLARKLAAKEVKNPVLTKTVHTAWQAAFGALVASLSATHGDVRVGIAVAGAAFAAALKNAVLVNVPSTTPPAVDPTMAAGGGPTAS